LLASLAGFFILSAILTGGFYYDLKIQNSTKVKGETREDSQPSIPLILPADGTIQVTQSANGSYLLSLSRDSVADHHIQDGAIEGDELARKSVHTYHLASGSITERMIEDGAIDTRHLDSNILIRKYLRVGDGKPSHFTLGTGDAYISDNLEVDGDAYFDETIYVRDSSSISTMTSNTLQTTTANISNILSNSHLQIKGRLPNEDYLKIDDFVKVFINPGSGTIVGADYDNIPTFQYIDGAGDLYVSDDLEVGGTIYGNISGAYSPSGDLNMDTHLITNIGNAGTDFTSTGGLILADGLTITGNITLSGTVDGKDIATYAAMLNEEEIITANWVNTANPWADNEVADNLSIIGGSIDSTTAIDKDPIITLSGDLSGNITLANLSGGTLAALVVADSVTLATDTTGNYIATLAGNSQIGVSGSGSENAAVSLSINTDSIGDSQLAYDTGQHLTTASSPTFAGLTLSGNLVLGANTFTTDNTGLVSNLNADLLDGQHGSYYAPLANLSGTAGYLSKFTGDNSIGNSVIYESGGNVGIGITAPIAKLHIVGNITSPGIGSFTEIFGYGASANNDWSTAIGNDATANSTRDTAVGYDALASGGQSVAIGASAIAGGQGATAIGRAASASGSNSVALGHTTSAPYTNSIALGVGSATTAIGQFVAGYGSLSFGISDVYFGRGVTFSTPLTYTIHGTGGSGTDIVGGSIQLAGGKGTGNAMGGDILFQTSDVGLSGTTLQSLSTKVVVKSSGNVGIGTTTPTYKIHVNGTAGFESTIYAPNIGTGEDNSVLVLGSSGNLVTDEIDSRVWGSSLLDYSGTNTGYVPYFSDADTLSQSGIYYDGTNVGIGTTSPGAVLDIKNNSSSFWVNPGFDGTGGGEMSAGVLISGRENGLNLIASQAYGGVGKKVLIGYRNGSTWLSAVEVANVASGYSNLLLMKTDGNVGIGTTAPTYKLHVNGTAGFESTIYAPNIGTGEDNSVLVLGSSGNLVTDEIDSRVWGSSLLDYSGTNTGYVPYFSDADTLSQSGIYYDGTNVGIGTTSPMSSLDIAGKIALSGTIIAYRPTNMSGSLILGNGGENLLNDTGSHGFYNTFVGLDAGIANTTGYDNTAVGYGAFQNNTSGWYSTAIGYYSLRANTTGSNNTALGYAALAANNTGYSNSAFGLWSLYGNTTGSNNIAFGNNAGRYIADGATANTTGDYNIFIGGDTKVFSDNNQNTVIIGYNATGIGSNSVVLGNDSILTTALKGNVGIGNTAPAQKLQVAGRIRMDTWTADGDVAVYYNSGTGDIGVTASDERLKTNIETIPNALSIVQNIRGITFNWKDKSMSKDKSIGIIAQEALAVMPELTFPITGPDGKEYLGVHYDKISPILIEAVKQQQEQISNLEFSVSNEFSILNNSMTNLDSRLLGSETSAEDRITVIGADLTELEDDFKALASRAEGQEELFDSLTVTTAGLTESVATLTELYGDHETRIAALENMVAEGLSGGDGVPAELESLKELDARLVLEDLGADGYRFDIDGNLKVKELEAEKGKFNDFETEIGRMKQVILESPSGACFKLEINDQGQIESEEVDCQAETEE